MIWSLQFDPHSAFRSTWLQWHSGRGDAAPAPDSAQQLQLYLAPASKNRCEVLGGELIFISTQRELWTQTLKQATRRNFYSSQVNLFAQTRNIPPRDISRRASPRPRRCADLNFDLFSSLKCTTSPLLSPPTLFCWAALSSASHWTQTYLYHASNLLQATQPQPAKTSHFSLPLSKMPEANFRNFW